MLLKVSLNMHSAAKFLSQYIFNSHFNTNEIHKYQKGKFLFNEEWSVDY